MLLRAQLMAIATLNELGFEKIINAGGHYTIIGGSCPPQEVVRAMDAASEYWADMNGLQKTAGAMLRGFLGCEDGIVTSGAYAALALATKTILSSREENLSSRVEAPNVVIQEPHVTKFAESFTLPGVSLKRIRRKSESDHFQGYIDRNSIALVYVLHESSLEFSLQETVNEAKQAGLPVIVDAAEVDPPVHGIREVLGYQPDFVAVSGGKGFNGPNNTGILIGKQSAIAMARALAFPNKENFGIGRAMKVSKEQIAGLITAIRLSAEADWDKTVKKWKEIIEQLSKSTIAPPGARIQTVFPWALNFPQPVPRLFITLVDQTKARIVRETLMKGKPPIFTMFPTDVGGHNDDIVIDPRNIEVGDLQTLSERLNAALRESA
jgi:D-glucosaminate-6-phosphate ammonia-lyase